jgi:hypothetical protein
MLTHRKKGLSETPKGYWHEYLGICDDRLTRWYIRQNDMPVLVNNKFATKGLLMDPVSTVHYIESGSLQRNTRQQYSENCSRTAQSFSVTITVTKPDQHLDGNMLLDLVAVVDPGVLRNVPTRAFQVATTSKPSILKTRAGGSCALSQGRVLSFLMTTPIPSPTAIDR